MSDSNVRVVLVPGAWMGAWIWEPTVRGLINRGFDAEAITLRGLAAGVSHNDLVAVRLEDHAGQLVEHVVGLDAPVILVSHSYSSMVTAHVADRLGSRVAGLIHFGGYLPIDGRSLLDDWGSSHEEREREKADIAAAGNLWLPPERAMLEYEKDLSARDRDFLADGFTPHPGQTVTDPARMMSEVSTQPATYVALSLRGSEAAWRDAPGAARSAAAWRRRHISSGHWPMLSQPQATVELLAEEIAHYSARRG